MLAFDIEAALELAFSQCGISAAPTLSPPNRNSGADLQCNTLLAAAASKGVPPRPLAEAVAARLSLEGVASVTVSGPGFLNFTYEDAHVARVAARASAAGGVSPRTGNGAKVVIDFGGPNIAKPLHVGHLRSFVIGESLRRILVSTGCEVVSDIHYGDWGLPIGKLFVGMALSGKGAAVEDESAPLPDLSLEDLGSLYALGNAAAKEEGSGWMDRARAYTSALQSGDPALSRLWSHVRCVSLSAISRHVERLSAHFDTYEGESDVEPLIEPMLARLVHAGLAVESDGALVAHVVEDGSIPPVLLRKSGGGSLYGTTDLATIVRRIAVHRPDRIVYCVDGRQSAHLKSVFLLAAKAAAAGVAGFDPLPELVHADFGTVNGPDGKPFSTRDGTSASLDDLISLAVSTASEHAKDAERAEAVGMAALKFADLSSDRRGGYVFDPRRMTSPHGRTGPYVQYAKARIASLLAKAAADGGAAPGMIGVACAADRALALECLALEDSVAAAAQDLQPKEVCDRAYGIASAVSRLYAEADVLRAPAEERAGRLALLAFAASRIETCLRLLGIGSPDRM